MSSSSLRRNRDGRRSNKQFASPNGMPVVRDPTGGYMYQEVKSKPAQRIAPRKERRRLVRLNEKIEQERARKPKVNVPQAVSDEERDE